MYCASEKSVPLEASAVAFLHLCAVMLVPDADPLSRSCEGSDRGAMGGRLDGESWSGETLSSVS